VRGLRGQFLDRRYPQCSNAGAVPPL